MTPQNQTKAYQQGSQQGYQHVPQPGSPTYTEAWALIEAARRMAVAIESNPGDDLKSRNAIRETIRLNWRLWTIFQAELTVATSTSLSSTKWPTRSSCSTTRARLSSLTASSPATHRPGLRRCRDQRGII